MIKLVFILPICCIVLQSQGQISFNVSSIPEALKKNAHSVIREEKIELDIKSPEKAYYKVHNVTTILDERGKDQLTFYLNTNKFISLESVELKVFDAAGKYLDKYTKKELSSQVTGEGLVPDGKVYFTRILAPAYPVTLQSDYELKYNGIYSLPKYTIQPYNQAIESENFFVRTLIDNDIHYMAKNTAAVPEIATDGKYKTYSWSFKNKEAVIAEEGSGNQSAYLPSIILTLSKFELDGYPGGMNSWKEMGLWYNTLVKSDNTLSAQFKNDILTLTNAGKTEKEKIKIIYTHLQKNFRYVSIQLGIGGLKPFSADFVHTKKYGDCKALSNYMQACLDVVNIKSYSAWVYGNTYPNNIDPGFPCDQFNHQILCVPLNGDTTWLECTSSTNDFAVLGGFTENRSALLLTENGGILVKTPKSKASDNLFYCNSVVSLSDDGSGKAIVTLKSTGEYKQDFVHYVSNEKKDDQKQFLVGYLGFTQPDEFEITNDKNNPQAETEIKMGIEKIPDFSAGSKMFLNPRIYKLWRYSLPKAENRTQDFYFEHPLIKTDTTVYHLPEGFGIETLPKAKNLQFEYGSFISDYRFDEKQKTITTTAKLILNEYKIPAAKFAAAKKFFGDVLAEYAEKIVIKRL